MISKREKHAVSERFGVAATSVVVTTHPENPRAVMVTCRLEDGSTFENWCFYSHWNASLKNYREAEK